VSSIEASSNTRKSVASGALSLAMKPPGGGVVLEQAVNRRREAARRFRQPLRRATGGGGEVHADFLGLQDFDERAQDRGLGARLYAGA
jgi:hypothetical protein